MTPKFIFYSTYTAHAILSTLLLSFTSWLYFSNFVFFSLFYTVYYATLTSFLLDFISFLFLYLFLLMALCQGQFLNFGTRSHLHTRERHKKLFKDTWRSRSTEVYGRNKTEKWQTKALLYENFAFTVKI